MAYTGNDGIGCRIDGTIQINPLTSFLIPHGDNQVFFVNPFGYLVGVIGKGKAYRRIESSPIRTQIIGQTNNFRVFRWGWWVFHLLYGYSSETRASFCQTNGTFIDGELNIVISGFNGNVLGKSASSSSHMSYNARWSSCGSSSNCWHGEREGSGSIISKSHGITTQNKGYNFVCTCWPICRGCPANRICYRCWSCVVSTIAIPITFIGTEIGKSLPTDSVCISVCSTSLTSGIRPIIPGIGSNANRTTSSWTS